MKTSDQYYCPKSDAYVKVLDGIELCLKQNSCFGEDPCVLYEKFQHNQKQNIQLVASGLWRKKRDLGLSKSSVVS
jgi:hypothetical protein